MWKFRAHASRFSSGPSFTRLQCRVVLWKEARIRGGPSIITVCRESGASKIERHLRTEGGIDA